MAATPSIKFTKETVHKGSIRLYSNRYHFNGGTPADSTHWKALADAILPYEKQLITSGLHVVEAIGYAAGSDVPVWSFTYNAAGTASYDSSDGPCPSDVAALLRYATTARTSKNHPIYLFSYYHNAYRETSSGIDSISLELKSEIEAFGTAWIAGFSDGTNTYVRSGPNGATGTSRSVEDYLTHRDFHR